MIVFLNGIFLPEADAVISIHDRGFLLGDGLFETVRVARGRPFRLAQHLERLARGAEFLKIKLPFALNDIQKFAGELIAKNELAEATLRVTLTRGVGQRGYSIHGKEHPTLALTLHPLPPANSSLAWNLITSSFRVPVGDALASFKSTSKLLNVLARAEAHDKKADEALLLNTNNEVTETAGGNLFWIQRNQVCTAPIANGVLPGITRAVVLEICRTLVLKTNQCFIEPEMLHRAEGIFVTQSAAGIIPVTTFDSQSVAASPLVDQIASAYHELLAPE